MYELDLKNGGPLSKWGLMRNEWDELKWQCKISETKRVSL